MADQIEMTETQIAALEAERAALQRTLLDPSAAAERSPSLRPADTPKSGIETLAAKLTAPAAKADAQAAVARRAEADELVGNLLTRGQAAATRLGILKAKNLDRVQRALSLPLADVRRVLPNDFKYERTGASSPSRNAVNTLEASARDLVGVLSSTIGDASRTPKDMDPVSLADCMSEVQAALASGRFYDVLGHALLASFRRSVSHLAIWVGRAEQLVNDAERLLKIFNRAEDSVAQILKDITPVEDVAPQAEKITISPSVPTPIQNNQTYGDPHYDPRMPIEPTSKSNTKAVKVDSGYRITPTTEGR